MENKKIKLYDDVEILYDESFSNTEYTTQLNEQGWKYYDSGSYSNIFTKRGKRYVIKTNVKTDLPTLEYLKFCNKNHKKNKHLLKVRHIHFLEVPYYNKWDTESNKKFIKFFSFNEKLKHKPKSAKNDDYSYNGIKADLRLALEYNDNKKIQDEKLLSACNVLRTLKSTIPEDFRCSWDIGGSNLLFRQDTIVFSDPWYGNVIT